MWYRLDLCLFCNCIVFFFFFWLGPPYGRTETLLYALNWNWTEITETCLSIRDIRTYFDKKNNWNLSVHPDIRVPYILTDFRTYWLKKNKNKKNDWLTSFRTDGRTSVHTLHCIALHCIALHCIALHCIVASRDNILHCILTERNAIVRHVCFELCHHV
jgi:hypothetical protein